MDLLCLCQWIRERVSVRGRRPGSCRVGTHSWRGGAGGRKGRDVCGVAAEVAPVRRGLAGGVWEWGTTACQAWRPEPANYAAQGSPADLPEPPAEVAWKASEGVCVPGV